MSIMRSRPRRPPLSFIDDLDPVWFDENAMTGCLATLDRLVRETPAFNLEFGLDSGVADLIDHMI